MFTIYTIIAVCVAGIIYYEYAYYKAMLHVIMSSEKRLAKRIERLENAMDHTNGQLMELNSQISETSMLAELHTVSESGASLRVIDTVDGANDYEDIGPDDLGQAGRHYSFPSPPRPPA